MIQPKIRELLEAGVHFGHQSSRWNPKMRKYIFAARNGIHIIDLKKTSILLNEAQQAVRDVVLGGGRVMFVCTKRQLTGIIEEEAQRCGAFYVTERWLGGMLTNFQTIKQQIRRLKELERGIEEGSYEFYTKKEQLLLEREKQKLEKYLSGVKDMGRLPGAMFVVDSRREQIAVREANKLEIPVIAIADTNADPDMIDFPIPGNDDAIRSVSLITRSIADAVEAANKEVGPEARRDDSEAVTYSTEHGAQEVEDQSQRPPRRRPRRKRRLRPEKIAQVRTGEDEQGAESGAESESDTEGSAGAPPAEAPAAESESGTSAESAESGSAESAESAEPTKAEAAGRTKKAKLAEPVAVEAGGEESAGAAESEESEA